MTGRRPERRAFDASLRANGKRSISGHASVFDVEYDIGPFREVIRPGTFAESIKQDDIRALWQHDAGVVLGRNKAGTLALREDSVGLAFTIDVPSWAGPQLETIRRGDVSQASFAFTVDGSDGEEFQRGTNGEKDLRVITKARLWDVSPVTYPASSSTDVSVRALKTYKAWSSRPRRSPDWYRDALKAMEADVGRERLRHRTKPRPKPRHGAPAADDRVVLAGRELADAVKEHRVEARKTCDHESAHALLFLYEGAGVDSVRMLWRKKWGAYRPAGGTVRTRGRSSSVTAASYVAGLVAENRRSGIGWNRAQASDSDLTAVRRLTRFSSDEWKAQETARRVLRRYYRVFDAISSRLLREGELSGEECSRIFEAERARLERLGRAVA